MSDKIAAALSIAAVLFLAGVIYVGATMPTRPQAMAYTLDIEARAAGDVVHASGETNLPDGALLHVVIDRLYRVAGQDLWSAARVGEARVPVVDKAWRAEIPIDDTQWVEELHGRLISREIDPVEAVHPSLRATVLFSPMIEQPESVQKSMGANFERLSISEQAEQEGDLWVLRRQRDFESPLRADLESRLMAVEAATGG